MAGIVEWYQDIMYNKYDPRTKDWLLVSRPGLLVTLIAGYIYFSVSVGPRLMRDRKPYKLKNALILYNFIQVLISIYLVYEGSVGGWATGYRFICEPVVNKDDPVKGVRMARAVHTYFLTKLVELLDTVFFVLRKKDSQISFLHVYHHALMPITSWIGVRYYPGGHFTLLGMINSLVHVFMYAYYLLAACGPQVRRYLWWKPYLTIMQLIQFGIILAQNVQLVYLGCGYPRSLALLLTGNATLFIYLFGSFYYHAYVEPRKSEVRANGTRVSNGSVKNE